MSEDSALGFCEECSSPLLLRDGEVACESCPAGLTPILLKWIANNPYVPDALADFIVPKHDHVIEVDGIPFATLADAEEYAARVGSPICCYTANKKVVNQ
jgi:hypothetical protein